MSEGKRERRNYSYDVDGNRIRKIIGSTYTYYVRGKDGETDAIIPAQTSTNEVYNILGNGEDNIAQQQWDFRFGFTYYYYLKDHLGSMKMILNSSGGVDSYNDYYPYGMQMPGRNSVSSADARYKYVGKERDAETNDDYLGDRYYNSWAGRELSVDPFADKDPSRSPYSYAGDCPIVFFDANGDTVDFSAAQRFDKTSGTSYTNTLVNDLGTKTGLKLSLNKAGKLVYATDKNGDPIVTTDENGNEVGSATARNQVTNLVSNSSTVEVFITPGQESQGNTENQIGLNPSQINSFISGASGGLDNSTLGWAMVFLHESYHTLVGGGLSDGTVNNLRVFGHLGDVVEKTNIIRSQLGPGYGQRISYPAMQIGNSRYIPFDRRAFNSLEKGILPVTKYIKY
jgi:RHS repeat-associated protein